MNEILNHNRIQVDWALATSKRYVCEHDNSTDQTE